MNRREILLGFLFAMEFLSSCSRKEQPANQAYEPVSESRILCLYDQLSTGMTREQVEAIVGSPLIQPDSQTDGEEWVHYIDKPEKYLESWESPFSFSGLMIIYKEGKLIKKQYNSQWIKKVHVEAYEKKKGSVNKNFK